MSFDSVDQFPVLIQIAKAMWSADSKRINGYHAYDPLTPHLLALPATIVPEAERSGRASARWVQVSASHPLITFSVEPRREPTWVVARFSGSPVSSGKIFTTKGHNPQGASRRHTRDIFRFCEFNSIDTDAGRSKMMVMQCTIYDD